MDQRCRSIEMFRIHTLRSSHDLLEAITKRDVAEFNFGEILPILLQVRLWDCFENARVSSLSIFNHGL